MSTNYFYGSMQIVDFMLKVANEPNHKMNPVEYFIGKYNDFPGSGLFTGLLFKSLSHFASFPAQTIPSFEEAHGIVSEYSKVLKEILDEDLDLDEDEVTTRAKRKCTIPNAAHTFVNEYSRTGNWMSEYIQAVAFFREIEHPKHVKQIKELLKQPKFTY